MEIKEISNTEADTWALGQSFSRIAEKGAVILLSGDLGAGKTVFSSGFVHGATEKDYSVTSPTFNIVQEYDGYTKVYHFDFYRVESLEELENIGVYEYLFDESAFCLIEWPERVEGLESILKVCYKVNIKKLNENSREINIKKLKG